MPEPNHSSEQETKETHDRRAQPVHMEEPPRLAFAVVALGASAGGLEACIEFFDAAPDDSGMAFVVILHLPPDRESMVAEILSKHTNMPVVQMAEGMAIEPNRVYVVRPGSTPTLQSGRFRLGEPLQTPGHNHPVDDFFRSLAEEQRERAICVVLSGMGSNGSAGAQVVKAVGGLVIAQEPESAKFPSMPRHLIDSGNADFILRPEEMPAVAIRFASHPYAARVDSTLALASQEAIHLKEILSILRSRLRLDFSGYKKPTVLRRIQRRMGLNQVERLADYAKLLRQSTTEASALADDLMIHVTGFFRDPQAWEALKERVILPMVAERDAESSIRCWVSACSSGEEAYTLAMLLVEAANKVGKWFDIKVFATDTAERTLAQARSGVYPQGIEAEITPERLQRFFDKDDAVYRVKKELRELVIFAPQNVIQDPPFSRMAICTCRNLLIYLEPEMQRRVLSLLHFGLREGGVLFLGTSETITGAEDLFQQIDKRWRIFRRVGPTRHGSVDFHLPLEPLGRDAESAALTVQRLPLSSVLQKVLLDELTPPAVAVDRQHRVVYVHGNTDQFLIHPEGEPTRKILPLVRPTLRGAVRSVLDALSGGETQPATQTGFIERDGNRLRVEVTGIPIPPKLATGYLLISFRNLGPVAPTHVPDALAGANESQLREELKRVQEELQGTIEELQTSNEEMKASNEEVMSINEELQSTNEELETSREELQSMNEELRTVNAQLQAKMEEQEATSNDLSSLLSSTDIAVVFLDMQFRIRRFTPSVKDLFEFIPTDVGRPLSDLARKFSDPDLMSDCQAVLEKLIPIEREVASTSGRIYMRRVLPYRTTDNHIRGVVLTFVDITERKRSEIALQHSQQQLRQLIEGSLDFAMFLVDVQGRIATWNAGAERILGYTEEEAIGQSASIIYPPEDRKTIAAREMQEAIEHGRSLGETWHVRKDGSRFWGAGVLSAVRNESGELTGFTKILRDDTARKRVEEERADLLEREQAARREAEAATALKDRFLATLSHELRTPLSSILMWSRMLRENVGTPAEREEGLKIIERAAEAQRQLLDDLLDTSRIASGKIRLELEETKLGALLRSALDAMQPLVASKKIELNVDISRKLPRMVCDPDRLRQVINNIVANAIKFTPEGGRIDVRLVEKNGGVELSVCDTGVGIDSEYLPHVFTAFSQGDSSTARNYGGLGLGMAISKQLVELHGGTIRVESDGRDCGAVFTVWLPAGARPEGKRRRTQTPAAAAPDSLRDLVVLLVEDDGETRHAITTMLAHFGARVTAVPTASTALEIFDRLQPSIIISDIGLPGKDGYAFLKEIRAREAQRNAPITPAIALTAFAGKNDRDQAHQAGYQEHLAKPVDPEKLRSVMQSLLESKAE